MGENKRHKVKKEVVINSVERGGINMIDFRKMNISLKAMWVKRLLIEDKNTEHVQNWKDLALYNAGINDRSLRLHKLDNSNPVQNSSLLYNQVLESWYTFYSIPPTSINGILNEKLHYNKFITIGGRSLSKKSTFLKNTQTSKIRDLVTNNRSNHRFKTIGELEVELKNSISCLQYNALISAIPTDWKTKLLKGEETNIQGKKFQIQHLRIDAKKLLNKTKLSI